MAHLANSQIHSQENQRSPSRYGYRGLKSLLTHFSINLSLVSAYRRLLLLTLAGLPVVVLSALIVKTAIAAQLGARATGPALRIATKLDPNNGDFHHRLGIVEFYEVASEPGNNNMGILELQRATDLDSTSSLYWADLGRACETKSDFKCADIAYEKVLALSPMRPRSYWQSANYYLRTGQQEKAISGFRRLLNLDPDYAASVFSVCFGALDSPWTFYNRILAGQPNAILALQFAGFLCARGKFDVAQTIWDRTISHAPNLGFEKANRLLDLLFEQGRYGQALGAWKRLVELGLVHSLPGESGNSLVFNGGFESQPLEAGFDWRVGEARYLAVDLASSEAFEGHRCLSINFTVEQNEEYEPVYQFIPVIPQTSYALQAYTRSSGITSECGPRLRVLDPENPRVPDVSTPGTVGTTSWHEIKAFVRTGPKTRIVRLSVWRPRCREYPTRISGTFWLDKVSLTPLCDRLTAGN